jgi:hypothetical protein
MEPLQVKAQLQGGNRLKDGSVSMRFVTEEEIGTELFAHIDSYFQHRGWLLFRPNQFEDSEIPKDDAEIDGAEPLWKRQQRTIYKLFMLRGGKPSEFHTFYRKQMELVQEQLGNAIEAEENRHAPKS